MAELDEVAAKVKKGKKKVRCNGHFDDQIIHCPWFEPGVIKSGINLGSNQKFFCSV